jgi:anti-sigma factor ChrR (cupin superfamily)
MHSPAAACCAESEAICAYALGALPEREMPAIAAHIAACPTCRRELESLASVTARFVAWPIDVLRPTTALQARLACRLAEETGEAVVPPPAPGWPEPEWQKVMPGIECKLLADDAERQRVSMLVRLAPGARYPAHTHAGLEELHLLDGELWIDERKLVAGDYNECRPGTTDFHVWSETGCTCVLVTSRQDRLERVDVEWQVSAIRRLLGTRHFAGRQGAKK